MMLENKTAVIYGGGGDRRCRRPCVCGFGACVYLGTSNRLVARNEGAFI
jgi:hypothetical protein